MLTHYEIWRAETEGTIEYTMQEYGTNRNLVQANDVLVMTFKASSWEMAKRLYEMIAADDIQALEYVGMDAIACACGQYNIATPFMRIDGTTHRTYTYCGETRANPG